MPQIGLDSGLLAGPSGYQGQSPPADFETQRLQFLDLSERPVSNLARGQLGHRVPGRAASTRARSRASGSSTSATRRSPRSSSTTRTAATPPGRATSSSTATSLFARGTRHRRRHARRRLAVRRHARSGRRGGPACHRRQRPAEPDVEAFIDLPCGSHTATGVPDPANDRLIIYSTPSSGACDGIDVIEIPLDDPSPASVPPLRGGGRPDRLPRHRRHPRRRPARRRVPAARASRSGAWLRPTVVRRSTRSCSTRRTSMSAREGHQHRPLGGVLQRRHDADLRP